MAEKGKTAKKIVVELTEKVDPKKHLEQGVNDLMGVNIVQCLGIILDTVAF